MGRNNIISRASQAARWDVYQSLLVQNRQDLEQSWQRCTDAGMDPGDRPQRARVSREELQASYAYERDHVRVRGLALGELRNLHKHLGKRGFSLTCANPDSVILDRIPGRDTAAGYCDGDDLAPGNCWYESARGTNAVGTAANTKRTTAVLGGDHFLRAYHDLICIAKPVFDASGGVVAILDATVHGRNGRMDVGELAYALGLMHMSVDHIEIELFKERHRDALVIQTNFESRAMASGNAAFAFDETGRLKNATRAALDAFVGLDIHSRSRFEDIFRADFDRLYTSVDTLIDFAEIEDLDGRCHYATIYPPARADATAQAKPGSANGVRNAPGAPNLHGDGGGVFLRQDPAVADILAVVERATEFGAPVLIRGETGTGKELLARYIHRASNRAGEFVGVNCAAVPESLIEAELFGYEAGAFTGARKGGALGLVREADAGTLFLDEIGDMPYELQARLLRMLDCWRIRPVGSEREYAVDVQLVTATNRNLQETVEQGRFRLDLFHRIQVIDVRLPALRERADFDEIVQTLFAEIEPRVRLEDGALEKMRELRWPGNIRELRNVITRLLIRAENRTVTAALVKNELFPDAEIGGKNEQHRAFAAIADADVEAAFQRCRGNVSATARVLGVSRTTVYKHLRHAQKTGKELGA